MAFLQRCRKKGDFVILAESAMLNIRWETPVTERRSNGRRGGGGVGDPCFYSAVGL